MDGLIGARNAGKVMRRRSQTHSWGFRYQGLVKAWEMGYRASASYYDSFPVLCAERCYDNVCILILLVYLIIAYAHVYSEGPVLGKLASIVLIWC